MYETRHTEPGNILITAEDGTLLREIPLPPGGARDAAEEQVRIANGQPLDFKPTFCSTSLEFPGQREDKIRLTIVAPENADPEDYHLRFDHPHSPGIAPGAAAGAHGEGRRRAFVA
jgi:hypothetical protein